MHELSLAGSILQLVEGSARNEAFQRVRSLRLSVPALAGVEVAALRFALAALAPGSLLEGARVDIDEPLGQACCSACGAQVEIVEHGTPCPSCGSYALQVTGGTEMRVVELMVE
jgi:hydrogenase nickel incorporation protein HypA/HybF